jgi:tRNA G18 (ribose-2'-O)-methylase SpoU
MAATLCQSPSPVPVIRVDDPADPRLDDYLRVSDAELRRHRGTFLCEGVLAIRRAAEAGIELRSLLVTATHVDELGDLDVPTFVIGQAAMNDVTGVNLHRGVIASATRPPARRPDDVLTGRTVAVVEGVNDLENLGAIFRNAAAFGIDAVLLDARSADPLHRRCVRVSLGHATGVPFARYDDLDVITAAGFELVALTPIGDETIGAVEQIDRAAIVLGAEFAGLDTDTLDKADHRVRIHMAAGVDSLNVATAAAIAFHHRARSSDHGPP